MLFRKKHPRSCDYCKHCTAISDEHILCIKKGVILPDNPCRKFRYDPLKRIPSKAKALDPHSLENTDFSL